jgi:hypothetical protein
MSHLFGEAEECLIFAAERNHISLGVDQITTLVWCMSPGMQVRSMIWAGRPINIPVILAGWWHAGGLMLNYEAWKEKEPVDGYIFYSPSFGYAKDEPIYLPIYWIFYP